MDKPKGGRGHRAPYLTTHLRVPQPIKDDLQSIIDQWRDGYLSGEPSSPVSGLTLQEIQTAIALLTEALTYKANTFGEGKKLVKKAIAILENS